MQASMKEKKKKLRGIPVGIAASHGSGPFVLQLQMGPGKKIPLPRSEFNFAAAALKQSIDFIYLFLPSLGPNCLGVCDSRPHSERFCDVALTVKFYCDCDVAKSLRMGPSLSIPLGA